MADVEAVKTETRETLGLGEEDPLDHITEELIQEDQERLADRGSERISAVREDGTPVSEEEVAEFGPEGTAYLYGTKYWVIGGAFYYKTDGVGQPCGTSITAVARNWKTAKAENFRWCSGGYWGHKFTFTF